MYVYTYICLAISEVLDDRVPPAGPTVKGMTRLRCQKKRLSLSLKKRSKLKSDATHLP